jgi:hypothetical protein
MRESIKESKYPPNPARRWRSRHLGYGAVCEFKKEQHEMRLREIFLPIIPILMIVLILIIASCALWFIISFFFPNNDWRRLTTPLEADTIKTLCKKFSLNSEDQLCNGEKDIYAGDFAKTFNEEFLPKGRTPANFENVNDVIGEYMDYCTPVDDRPASGYFRCDYDLTSNGTYIFFFYYYYPDNTLFEISSGAPDD